MKVSKKWRNAYNSLYGNDISCYDIGGYTLDKKSNLEKKKPINDERHEQITAVAWIQRKGIPVHHSPNGGKRDVREAARFKQMGTSAGFPDLFIPRVRHGKHGLYIEMKRSDGGKLSNAQIYWRDLLLAEGYAWYEAHGAQECIKIVENYLGLAV